jgi:penicillin amidase
MQTFLGLGRARTAEDVERAARGYGSPAQNLLYATREGIAGYRLMGRVVRRPPGEPSLPREGTTRGSDWIGDVPEDDLPAFRLAPTATCVTANDPHVGPEYPHYLSNLYEPGYRAERIRSLLAGRSGLVPADLAAVQMDVVSLAARAFRRAVLLPHADAVRATRPGAAAALDRLLGWDGRESTDALGAALFHFAYYHLLRRTFAPSLGDALFRRWMALVNLMDAPLLAAFSDAENPWVKPSVRPTLLGEALEDARQELAARGLSLDARWGDVHRLTLRHPLSAVPLVGDAWTRGPLPMPGGPFTPLAGQYLHHRPVDMFVGASYRQVVDLADPEGRSWMITFGGQSGHVGSRHYDDLTPGWLRGRFLPMRLESLPEGGTDLRLLPA